MTIDAHITAQSWERLDIEGDDCFAILGGAETTKCFHPTIVFECWPAEDVIRRTKALFDALNFRLECLLWDGERCPFCWIVPNGNKYVDVLCSPL